MAGQIACVQGDLSEAILELGGGRGGVGRAASGFSQGVCGEAKRGGVLQAPRSAANGKQRHPLAFLAVCIGPSGC